MTYIFRLKKPTNFHASCIMARYVRCVCIAHVPTALHIVSHLSFSVLKTLFTFFATCSALFFIDLINQVCAWGTNSIYFVSHIEKSKPSPLFTVLLILFQFCTVPVLSDVRWGTSQWVWQNMSMKLIDFGLFSAAKCYCIVKQILDLLQKMICVYTVFKNCVLH